MRFFTALMLASFAVIGSGCFSTGTKVEQSATTGIQKGITTKAEVVALLGNPLSATFIDGGKELLTWSHGQTKVNPAIFIPLVGLAVEDSKTNVTTFQVIFNKDKIVEDTLWNTSEVGSSLLGALGLPASKATFATPAADAEAKRFTPKPGKAKLFVYRESHFKGGAANFQIFLDGRQLGVLASGSFACLDLAPKKYIVRISGENTQDVAVEVEAGKLYFIRAEPRMGLRSVAVDVNTVDLSEGEKSVTAARLLSLDFDPGSN